MGRKTNRKKRSAHWESYAPDVLHSEPQQTPIIIIGAGVFVSDIIELIRESHEFKIEAILDPSPNLKGQNIKGVPIMGWLSNIPENVEFAVIGTPALPEAFNREAVFHVLLNRGIKLPILKSFSSRCASNVNLKAATLILPNSTIKEGAVLGKNSLIGANSKVGENVEIEDHLVVEPDTKLIYSGSDKQDKLRPYSLDATLAQDTESIQEIIRKINWSRMEIILITSPDGALTGTITDGDIRRGILAGLAQEQPVSTIMNSNPVTAPLGISHQEMVNIMKRHSIRHLPIVDNQRKPVRIEILDTLLNSLKDPEAIVMAGGLGSRLRPLTNKTPKPLLPVAGKPILDHILSGLHKSGIKDIAISVNYLANHIKDHVGDGREYDLNVAYLTEQHRLGTAGALSLQKPRPRRPFLVMNGDLLTNMDYSKLLRFQKKYRYDVVMCVRKHETQIPYGVVEIENENIISLKEKPVCEHFINAGIYVLHPSCLDLIPRNSFFDMTDLVNAVLEAGGSAGAFPVIEYWRDIGTPADLSFATSEKHKFEKKTLKKMPA